MTIDGPIESFSPFHNINCPKGFLYFNKQVCASTGRLQTFSLGLQRPAVGWVQRLLHRASLLRRNTEAPAAWLLTRIRLWHHGAASVPLQPDGTSNTRTFCAGSLLGFVKI